MIVGVALLLIARGDNQAATSPPETSLTATTTAPSTTAIPDTKNEVITRLREILQVREQAFSKRDASLFDDVYTSSCPCLRAGRDAIAALSRWSPWAGGPFRGENRAGRPLTSSLLGRCEAVS